MDTEPPFDKPSEEQQAALRPEAQVEEDDEDLKGDLRRYRIQAKGKAGAPGEGITQHSPGQRSLQGSAKEPVDLLSAEPDSTKPAGSESAICFVPVTPQKAHFCCSKYNPSW